MEAGAEESGLSTREALTRLHVEIETVLQQWKHMQKSRKSKSWIRDTFSHSSQHTTINWVSSAFQLWAGVSLLLAFLIDPTRSMLLVESFIILLLLVCNVCVELYDNKLRHDEIPNRVQSVLDTVKCASEVVWRSENYPNLCMPYTPCITLQWTYRDNELVNLPWSLLVKDDVIVVRPGQISPGFCEAVDKTAEFPLLHAKEVYSPSLQSANEIFSAPKCRKPLENKKYRLLETPYLNNLKIYLEQALDRPVTQLNHQRRLVTIRVVERVLLPVTFVLVFFANLFRFFHPMAKSGPSDTFLVVPVTCIVPLLPLVFPSAWNLLNYFGLARFRSILDASRRLEAYKDNPLEEDTETTTVDFDGLSYSGRQLRDNFLAIVGGKADLLIHSANIVHVLGSMTALGCVDKKGILSWPNPTAEKVFFLHNNENASPTSSLGNVGDLMADGDSAGGTPHHYSFESANAAVAEVLDLTHNHSEPFKLHFDDQEWQRFLTSLKPLGLAILLNTCNVDTQGQYSAFCSHITCEAIYNEHLVPVSNRRCLCELAKEIGFVDQAQKIFSLEQQLSTFRHLQPEMVRRDNKYARSLQLSTKLKFPFPHMFAVVVRELSSGAMQLLSEGTADIILDSCVDYWDGNDLCPLTPSDKKKIQDFYQRSSLTAYCTAFAYRPLNKCVGNKSSGMYLELPSDSRHLYMNYRSPTPVHWECKSVLEPRIKTPLGQFYSTDSLLYNDCPSVDISDAESCFQVQCNQVFIGMVTMQYQALTDMVQLIEQLERACIRFVHFSKENELRSRVFSEKMGLESGWNCHISLLSERNSNLESSRTMSFSAPSAINMEHSVVKFDTEQERLQKNASDQSDVYSKVASHDSVQLHNEINTSHDWQSLSCLTDSTEQSAPINFDMSNRAKLPRGIDKIRPHIELIDNVPLLVSLFTDCTPSATRDMLQIMQDYGEIVCILGSSANYENAGIFMQADASVAVDPLYPQMCQKISVYAKPQIGISPNDLSCQLNSVPCSLCFRREDPISLYHLVMEARHFVTILWSCVQFWVSCCVVLSLIQTCSVVLMLPPIFTTGQVLWLTCVVVPLLSVSLMGLPVDPEVMKKPQGKNQIGVNLNLALFIFWCYGLKFLPTVFVAVTSFGGVVGAHCVDLCAARNCTCEFFYLPTEDIWTGSAGTLSTARLIVVFIVLLHFVIISVGFVHRDHLIYRKLPMRNVLWLGTTFVLVVLQSIYTILSYFNLRNKPESSAKVGVPVWVIIYAALSPLVILLINELIKQQEIMANKRFRKRARLDFGTKLGMNSPF